MSGGCVARASRDARRSRRQQRGQSLVEMAVVLIALVPMAAGVALLGQYMHIQQQAQSAAREAAWAATVDPALAQQALPDAHALEQTLRARQFADAGTPVRTGEAAPAQFADPLLTTFAGRELLKPAALTLTTYTQESSPSYLDRALSAVGKVAGKLGRLPPNTQGLVTAEVHLRPEPILGTDGQPLAFLDPLDSAQLDFSARSVLLADTWDAAGAGEKANGKPVNASNNRSVRSVIRPLVPTDWLGSTADDVINRVVHVLGEVPLVDQLFTPGLNNFELGRTAPDVVPTDKLVRYAGAH